MNLELLLKSYVKRYLSFIKYTCKILFREKSSW